MFFNSKDVLDYEKLAGFIIKEVNIEKLNRTEIEQCLIFIEQALKKDWPVRKKGKFLSVKEQLEKRLAEIKRKG
jgi:hypothetical protein